LRAGTFTPDRRAFESPIAIACFRLRTGCFPERPWCISSRTNSPAWVLGAFPARAFARARFSVRFSGIAPSSRKGDHGRARTGSPAARLEGAEETRDMAELGMRKPVMGTYDEVLARLPELLKAEGFGVLTRIDVKATLKEKLGVDFRRYQILGACNPKMAHQALSQQPAIGVMLPCNVVVWEEDSGQVVVTAVDPLQTIASQDPSLRPIAGQVREMLARVLESV
jgi:uncharacterized protein (DUF302 family)